MLWSEDFDKSEAGNFCSLIATINQFPLDNEKPFDIKSGDHPYTSYRITSEIINLLHNEMQRAILTESTAVTRKRAFSFDGSSKIYSINLRYLQKNGDDFKIQQRIFDFSGLATATAPDMLRHLDVIFGRNEIIWNDILAWSGDFTNSMSSPENGLQGFINRHWVCAR